MACSGAAQAANLTPEQESALKAEIGEQTRRLELLHQQILEADAKLAEIRQALGIDTLAATRGGTATQGTTSGSRPVQVADASSTPDQAAVERVASSSSDNRPPKVAPIFDQPGVLTPRGKFVIEPGLQYAYSSSNRVSIVGYTIIPALTIGLIDVREVRRNTFTASLTGRWGITNRFEIEAKLPYVYRSDSVLERPINTGSGTDTLYTSSGHGIGDVEVTGRYQLNDGGINKPYYIGTLRFKSRTGKDPFEVPTQVATNPNTLGPAPTELQAELPTGSGFYTLQPGVTVLYPTDPAVFFGSLSYQYNFERKGVSLNTTGGPTFLGDVKAGDVIGFNFGMGLALNDRSSFSIGYDHSSVGKTTINGAVATNSVRTELGTLLLGYSQRLSPTETLNVSVGAGVTRDTPDVTLAVRMPVTF